MVTPRHKYRRPGMSKMHLVRLTSKMRPISASNKCVCVPKMRLVASASITPGQWSCLALQARGQ